MKNYFFLFLCSLFGFISNAQLSVTVDKLDATYFEGESVQFNIQGVNGQVTYKFAYKGEGFGTAIQSIDPSSEFINNTVTVSTSSPTTVTVPNPSAGVIICEVSFGGAIDIAVAFYKPFDIQSFSIEPNDFETFWKNEVTTARGISSSFQLTGTPINHPNSTTRTFSIQVDGIDDLVGYISIPNASGSYPLIMKFPAAGQPGIGTQEIYSESNSTISVVLNVHKDISSPSETSSDSAESGITNRTTFYYKHVILGAIKLIDYLYSGNIDPFIKFDASTKIGLYGESQGGGLSLIVAGLDQFIDSPNDRVRAVSVSNPALCEHLGYLETPYRKASGYPEWLEDTGSGGSIPNNVKYYDAAFFTERFNYPIFMTVGYKDKVCQAATNFTALNNIKTNTLLFTMRDDDHAHPYWEWRRDQMNFFKKYLNNNITGANLGYHIDAGIELNNIGVNTTTQLDGTLEFNGATPNFPIVWDVVSQPSGANVIFNNPNIIDPTATFPVAGNYVLRVRAQDDYTLVQAPQTDRFDNSFYTIIDYVNVQVGSGCNSSTPTISQNGSGTYASGAPVLLTASGCNGTVTWYRDGQFLTTGSTFSFSASSNTIGNYYATCTESGCTVSGQSNSLNISLTGSQGVDINVCIEKVAFNSSTVEYEITVSNEGNTNANNFIVDIGGTPQSGFIEQEPSNGNNATVCGPTWVEYCKWNVDGLLANGAEVVSLKLRYYSSSPSNAPDATASVSYSGDTNNSNNSNSTTTSCSGNLSFPIFNIQNLISSEKNGREGKLSSISKNKDSNILIYPNPAKNQVFLDLSNLKERIQNITIYNSEGKVEKYISNFSAKGFFELNTKDFNSGVYILSIEIKDSSPIIEKVIIQN